MHDGQGERALQHECAESGTHQVNNVGCVTEVRENIASDLLAYREELRRR